MPPSEALGHGPIGDELGGGRLGLLWGSVEAFSDPPTSNYAPISRMLRRRTGQAMRYPQESFCSAHEWALLHVKAAVFDRDKFFIGSMNFDPRSERYSMETGLFIHSAEVAYGCVCMSECSHPWRRKRCFAHCDPRRQPLHQDHHGVGPAIVDQFDPVPA